MSPCGDLDHTVGWSFPAAGPGAISSYGPQPVPAPESSVAGLSTWPWTTEVPSQSRPFSMNSRLVRGSAQPPGRWTPVSPVGEPNAITWVTPAQLVLLKP